MDAKIRGIFEMCKMFNKNIFITIYFPLKSSDIQLFIHPKILFILSIPLSNLCIFFCINFLTFFIRTFKKQFFVLTHSFLVVYQSVMHKYIKTVGERGVKLALYYIKCLQMIEIQAYARNSKPRWNTLF